VNGDGCNPKRLNQNLFKILEKGMHGWINLRTLW
jgi:hypothetical protein